ncbi:hypothetical protein BYT27DRAFT_6551503 [Phlegmacium glaucopus]|nr:hypothetical protein BYT27DRAFT_6551503 [Phlegmacium glaucopus]
MSGIVVVCTLSRSCGTICLQISFRAYRQMSPTLPAVNVTCVASITTSIYQHAKSGVAGLAQFIFGKRVTYIYLIMYELIQSKSLIIVGRDNSGLIPEQAAEW